MDGPSRREIFTSPSKISQIYGAGSIKIMGIKAKKRGGLPSYFKGSITVNVTPAVLFLLAEIDPP